MADETEVKRRSRALLDKLQPYLETLDQASDRDLALLNAAANLGKVIRYREPDTPEPRPNRVTIPATGHAQPDPRELDGPLALARERHLKAMKSAALKMEKVRAAPGAGETEKLSARMLGLITYLADTLAALEFKHDDDIPF